MNPVEKAVWFIESHSAQALDLDEIAQSGGLSRFHMCRAFVVATGRPVIGYLRARRLTEAARQLACGAPDILSVALEAGYGSHEAFTRAFRDQFGITPEQVRAARDLEPLNLVEPIVLDSSLRTDLSPPRLERGRALLIAGLTGRYGCEGPGGIPAQWQRFGEHIGHIPGELGDTAYGVVLNGDDLGNFDYVSGVEVADFSDLPDGFVSVRLPARLYAVFHHAEHVSTIRRTMHTIYTQWLPESAYEPDDAPFFERYGPEFDPRTGEGGLEAWIPVKLK